MKIIKINKDSAHVELTGDEIQFLNILFGSMCEIKKWMLDNDYFTLLNSFEETFSSLSEKLPFRYRPGSCRIGNPFTDRVKHNTG
jgi:hypothetical protein